MTALPFPGPAKGDCGCGCGAFGTLKKESRDGTRCVSRACRCRRCVGKNNRRSGLAKQRTARKALGVTPQKFGDANEERWSDPLFANEVKSGKQCGPALNAWRKAEAQVLANRPDHGGMAKPTRVTWMPDGWGSEGLVTVRLSTWNELVRPALEEFYGEAS